MKAIITFGVCFLLIGSLFHFSCQKKFLCPDCKVVNQPPIANAGHDTLILLPIDSTILDGSASTDPDGSIQSYQWAKIAGAASFNFNNLSAAKTTVKKLAAGTYQFELVVTDNGGLSAKDTVQVVVDSVATSNRPPIADAGNDTTIILPVNSITLDGSGSTDPDNNINGYVWTKISGPSSFNIANINFEQTQLTDLIKGIYLFELTVTDTEGLFSKDTMQVTVNILPSPLCGDTNRPHITAQLIPVGTLSQARVGMAVASSENKILFAGGIPLSGSSTNQSSRVDIYDLSNQSWSTAELCSGRYAIAAVTVGTTIFFGGGETGDGTWPVDSVDIYDAVANTWSVSHLSTAGHSIAAAAVANKVFFAGGDGGFKGPGREKRVDIFDITSNSWSTSSLSESKGGGHSAITVNNKIYFAGGENWPNGRNGTWATSNEVDIYDNNTNTWSTSSMQEGKEMFATIQVAEKIYWAGGLTGQGIASHYSCLVEILDPGTGNSSIEHLFSPAGWFIDGGQNTVVKDTKIVFVGSNGANKFDLYDVTTNTWSIGVLPANVDIQQSSIISVNNTIYVAGGLINAAWSTQVWRLEF